MSDTTAQIQALLMLGKGLALEEVSRRTGVPSSDLREWQLRADQVRTRLGGDARGITRLCVRCQPVPEPPSPPGVYSYLLGLYLGDGHIARAPHNKGVQRLEIACSDVWPGLIEAAADAVGQVMPHLKVGRRRSTGCTKVGAYSKHWSCLFPQHGPGHKHTRKIELQPWQRQIIEEYPREFIRGLIHSDGCRSMNKIRKKSGNGVKLYEYPRYFFTNASDDIRMMFTDALDQLGIPWQQMNARNISIARREAVARLDEFIGPKY